MIILDLFLTAIIYLVFPVVMRMVKGKIPRKQAKMYITINVVVGLFLFGMIRASAGGDFSLSAPVGVTYWFIGVAILSDKEDPKQEGEKSQDNFQQGQIDDIQKSEDFDEEYFFEDGGEEFVGDENLDKDSAEGISKDTNKPDNPKIKN